MSRGLLRVCTLLLAAVTLAACAARRAVLEPVPAEQARAALAAARARLAAEPQSVAARVALGVAQYDAGDDGGARETLRPALEVEGELGARANLYYAASAERQADYAEARRGYARFLTLGGRSGDVERRLERVTRLEAEAAARTALANERSLNPAEYPEHAIGVAPLRVDAADTSLVPLGYGLADLLITDLSRSARLQLVDRVRVDALLRELKLAEGGAVDPLTAPRVGRLVGARRLVSGTLTQTPGGTLQVSATVTDVQTGGAVGEPVSASTTLADVLDAEKQLAFRLFDELGVTLTPAERVAVEQRPTRALAAFLAYSRGVRGEALGRLDEAAAAYAEAVRIDPTFTLAGRRLSSVRAVTSQASAPAAQAGPATRLSGLIDGLNPSPASRLGNLRDRRVENVLVAAPTSTLGVIIIIVNTIPPGGQ